MEIVGHSQAPLSPILLDELIIEILSWLPVKYLLQFRCVSKSWKSLISHNPQFVKLHLQRSPKNANLILTIDKGCEEYEEIDMRAIFCPKQYLLDNNASTVAAEDRCFRLKDVYWFVGSCNGLICFRKSPVHNVNVAKIWVLFWNPALRLSSNESPCLYVQKLPGYRFSPSRYGFGYDNSSDTYKVIVIILGSQNNTVKVHSMGDNCWRQILSLPAFPILSQLDGQFLNGTINWLALKKSGFSYDWGTVTVNELVIFSLDLEKETYKQLMLPGDLDEVPSVEPTLGVLGDCLCFFRYYKETHFVIWQMKEFGDEKSWTKLINISYQHLQIDNDGYHPLLPLCTSKNGDVVVVANNEDFEAILYIWKNNRFERIEIPNNDVWMIAKDYVPSLVLPC